jgi:hypothetical protein
VAVEIYFEYTGIGEIRKNTQTIRLSAVTLRIMESEGSNDHIPNKFTIIGRIALLSNHFEVGSQSIEGGDQNVVFAADHRVEISRLNKRVELSSDSSRRRVVICRRQVGVESPVDEISGRYDTAVRGGR